MDGQFTPTRVLMLLGGVGLIISSFLDWRETAEPYVVEGSIVPLGTSGWELGMLGLWQTIIGAVFVLVAIAGMAGMADKLPTDMFGFNLSSALVMLAVAPLLWNFALQFDQVYGGLGVFLGWIAAAIAIAGTIIDTRVIASPTL